MKHLIFGLLVMGIIFFGCPAFVLADYTTDLEQQINLIDQEYATLNSSGSPTDNSLGLVQWNASAYSDAQVYFEAVIACSVCTGGNARAVADLTRDTGDAVSGATVTSTSGTYELVRTSSPITGSLTDGAKYTVRLSRDADSGTAFIKVARLVVIQSGTNLTGSATQIEIGNNTTTTYNQYLVIPGPKIWNYNSADYTDVQSIKFAATLSASSSEATAAAALSDTGDCHSLVEGSEVTTTGTGWSYVESGDLASHLTNHSSYWVCLITGEGDTGAIGNAKVIIDQHQDQGIAKFTLYHTLINTSTWTNSSSYSNENNPISFNPSHFKADLVTYRFASTLSSNGATGYIRLFNTSDGATITGSELSTTYDAYNLQTSDDLTAQMPGEPKLLDSQLRNSDIYNTTASSSWLIIALTRIPDPQMSFTISGVSEGTVHNGITTSVDSDYNTLPFDHLVFDSPKFTAHQLVVTTNTESGYEISVKLLAYIQGLYPGNNIDPFTVAWDTPAVWSTPDGTTPNDNTGWFGGNTTDTRVPGWESGNLKFGAITNSPQTVMESTGPDSGTAVYVTYAMEVNILQPSDEYQGSLIYSLIPKY